MRTASSILFLSTILFVDATVTAQSRTGSSYVVWVSPQASLTRIGADALASGGASVAERGLPTASFTNPAGMQFTNPTAYAEFGKYTTSKWFAGLDYNGQFVLPTVLSIGMPVDGFSVSLNYFRQYSNRMSTGPIIVTTPAYPEGTGEVVYYERSVEVHSFCGSGSVALNDEISLGFTLGGNYLKHTEDLSLWSIRGSDYGFFVIGGIQATVQEGIAIGVTVRFNQAMRYIPEINTSRPPPNPPSGGVLVNEVAIAEAQLPPIVELGLSWQATHRLKLLASMEFFNWTTVLDDARNRWQIHLGGVADVHNNLALRFGYFTLSNWTGYNEEPLNQQFATLGVQLKVDPLLVSLAVMDSHLFKKSTPSSSTFLISEPFYQTYLSSGFSFSF